MARGRWGQGLVIHPEAPLSEQAYSLFLIVSGYDAFATPAGSGRNASTDWPVVPVLFSLADVVLAAGTPLAFSKNAAYLSPRDGRQVFLFENTTMMKLMPGDDVRQRTDGNLVLVGSAAALPRIAAQSKEQCQRCSANLGQLVGEIRQRAVVEPAVSHVIVLLESFDRRPVSARNTQRAV